jgi:hypothetical protein
MRTTSFFLLLAALAVGEVRAADWVSPTGCSDTEGKWSNEPGAYDRNTGTYASDGSLRVGWGAWIELTYASAVRSSRVRVNADWWTGAVDAVEVGVYKDGAWLTVWQGAIADCAWTEKEFPIGNVSKLRFRFRYTRSDYYFWLYEIALLSEPLSAKPATAETLAPSAVEATTALLHGRIADDGGAPCDYRFRYGPTREYGQTTPWQRGGEAGTHFTERVIGLSDGAVYHVQAQVRNAAGEVSGDDAVLVACAAAAGWLPATACTDPDGRWDVEALASNDNSNDCARSYHDIWADVWGSFIYLTRPATPCDGVRFLARQGGYVDWIDVDVYRNGVWVNLYEGPYADKQWVELNFAVGTVTQARARFHVNNANCGLYWELNEFEFRHAPPAGKGGALILSRRDHAMPPVGPEPPRREPLLTRTLEARPCGGEVCDG